MEKKIIPARIEDAVIIKNIDDVSFEKIFHEDLKYYEQCFKNGYDVFLLMVDGIAAGALILSFIDYETVGIESISIAPQYQKKGLSKFLMDFVDVYAAPYKKIILEVYIGNKKAIDIYTKKGYDIIATLEDYYADGYNAYVMEKKL